jgi:enterochelin esterase-like enzyme
MHRFLYGLVVIGFLLPAPEAHAQARTVRMPSAAGVQHVFAVLLPKSYDESTMRYPVVYLFHGGGQDHTAFMARNAFRRLAPQLDMIMIMPAADRSYSARGTEGRAQFQDFVATELVDYVDSHYRTIPSREARAIAGLSMGGGIATMTGLRHPRQFGLVGAFSPAIGADAQAVVDSAAAGALPYFYVSCGTADSLIGVNRQFVGWLEQAKVAHEYHEARGAGHTWNLWDEQIGLFLELVATRTAPLLQSQR